MACPNPARLHGVVEQVETFFLTYYEVNLLEF